MNKKFLAIFLLSGVIGLSGCSIHTGTKAVSHNSIDSAPKPEMSVYASSWDTGDVSYYYTIDEKTGVVYIECDGYRRHGITVAYNADGTVMTKEDLYGTKEN